MEKTHLISVIIPTYKSPEVLDLCLKSVTEGQKNENQIIVVVDGFLEINRPILEKYERYIDILVMEENVGLCKGTNLGVYNASHDKILIINDDNVAPKKWDIDLLESYSSNSVISPNQIEPFPSMFKQFHIKDLGRDPASFNLAKFWEYERTIKSNNIEPSGSTMPIFMSKYDYLRVGGWDENYEQGMVADWDFFLKCSISGMNMLRTYKCNFYHFASLSVSGEKRQQAELIGHEYAKYKWGSNIYSHPENNLKFIL